MKKMERSSILDVFIKDNWYKAQVVLTDMCLTVSLIDNYLDSVLNENHGSQGINEIRRIRIVKTTEDNFGISIKGGKENNMPIFISKIFKDTPADQTGQLYIGDSILSVNGESLVDATHEDAVRALKNSGNRVDLEVKYLREVMLQYKKASLLPEIGWNFHTARSSGQLNNQNNNQSNNHSNHQNHNDQNGRENDPRSDESFFLPRSASATGSSLTGKLKSDTRTVPLLLCHLFKHSASSPHQSPQDRADFSDPRVITIFSPDLQRSLVLRCPDEVSAYTTASAISNEIHEATLNALAEANMNLAPVLNSSTVKYMGWLSEKNESSYCPVFLCLTNKELLFFDKVPYTVSGWASPFSRYPLEHCRLVKGPLDEASVAKMNGSTYKEQSKLNSFALRIGTAAGVTIVQLSSNSYQSLLIWAKNIFESSCNAAIALQEVSFNCIFEGKNCELLINIDHGFTVKEKESQEVVLRKEFSELVNSSDDNARFVTLQFKNEKVSRDFDLLAQPKPFTFTLHTFLFTKLFKMGFSF